MDMKTPVSPKVSWPALIGAAVTILAAVASGMDVEIPPAVQAAVHTVAMAFVGWLVTDPLRQPPE